MGKGHSYIVLIGSFDNIVIADRAAGLSNIGYAALVGTLYIVAKWEEGIGAKGYAGNPLEIFLLFLTGQWLRLLSEDTLPVLGLQEILPLLRNIYINGIVTIRATNLSLEWQGKNLWMLAEMPYISLASCQAGAVYTGLLAGTDADGLAVLGIAYGVGLGVLQGNQGNEKIPLGSLINNLVLGRNIH